MPGRVAVLEHAAVLELRQSVPDGAPPHRELVDVAGGEQPRLRAARDGGAQLDRRVARERLGSIQEVANALADNLPAPKASSGRSRRRRRKRKKKSQAQAQAQQAQTKAQETPAPAAEA